MVVGGGAAGIYGAIRAKTVAPNLNVLVIEKAKPLSKVCRFVSLNYFIISPFLQHESEMIMRMHLFMGR